MDITRGWAEKGVGKSLDRQKQKQPFHQYTSMALSWSACEIKVGIVLMSLTCVPTAVGFDPSVQPTPHL